MSRIGLEPTLKASEAIVLSITLTGRTKYKVPPAGLEPATFGFVDQRSKSN